MSLMDLQTVVVVALLAFTVLAKSSKISCKDEKGNPVDWYFLYNLPNLPHTKYSTLKPNGSEYYYLDNKMRNFTLSKKTLEDIDNPFAQTLAPIFKIPSEEIAFLVYNDQKPGTKYSARGHTKGTVSFDNTTGFWLIHSVPRFPDASGYKWPENAYRNGQSALCVSFNVSQMESIAKQMMYTSPNIYNNSLPASLVSLAPTFKKVLNKEHIEVPPWSQKATLESLGGLNFIHYAKYMSYNKDLYSDFVAADLKAGIFVESWRWTPATNLPSNCSGIYPTWNVNHVELPDVDFSYRNDHSKWVVTDSRERYICIGDINRTKAQCRRSGGTLCVRLPRVWRQYHSIIGNFKACNISDTNMTV